MILFISVDNYSDELNCSVNKQTDRSINILPISLVCGSSVWWAAPSVAPPLSCDQHAGVSAAHSSSWRFGSYYKCTAGSGEPTKHTVWIIKTPPDRTKPSGHCLWNFKNQALCKGNIHVAMYRWLYLLRRTVVLFFWEVKWTSQILAERERERETKHSSSAHHQKRAANDHTHTHTHVRWQTAGQIY